AKPGSAPTATTRPLPTTTTSGLHSEVVASGLSLPSALAFAPDGRLFFIEVKKGVVRVLDGRNVQTDPVASIAVARGAEHGLIGLALDPDFVRNQHGYHDYHTPRQDRCEAEPRHTPL